MSSSEYPSVLWIFGPYRLDPKARLLYRDAERLALEPKVVETLAVLVQAKGRVVLKDELLEAVWPGTFVEEGSLARNVSILRRLLDPPLQEASYIETVPKRGYRFAAPVEERSATLPGSGSPAAVGERAVVLAEPVGEARGRAVAGGSWWGTAQAHAYALAAVGVLVVIGVAALAWLGGRGTGRTPQTPPERLTSDVALSVTPAMSPDGSLLAFASARSGHGDLDIWLQRPGGAAAVRLTDASEDDDSPDFSPDGQWIVFRSDREPAGVYVMPSLGGPARLLVRGGRRPRFSPDGTQVAYWTGIFRGPAAQLPSEAYTVSVTGGASRHLLEGFAVARDAVWAPDGKGLLVLGKPDAGAHEGLDWWWVSPDGSGARQTHALDLPGLRAAAAGAPTTLEAGAWTESGVLFTFQGNLWVLPMDTDGVVSGEPRQLTRGTGPYTDPSASRSGDVVFSALEPRRVVELASLQSTETPPSVVYADARPGFERTTLTRDAASIVLERLVKPGLRQVVSRALATGQEKVVVEVQSANRVNATVSHDGSRIVYTPTRVGDASVGDGFVVDTVGGLPRRVCTGCMLYGFFSDNRRVLAVLEGQRRIGWIDTSSGASATLVRTDRPGATLDRPHLAPNDALLAFRESVSDELKSYVIDLSRSGDGTRPSWFLVDEPTTTGRPLGWSEDASLLYLFLESDGFRCVWAQRFTSTGKMQGAPFAVRHWHRSLGLGLSTGFGNAVAGGRLLYEYSSRVGNIWRLRLDGGELD